MAKGLLSIYCENAMCQLPKEASAKASTDIQTDTWMAFILRHTQVSISRRSLDKEQLNVS
jgi:hypothetical protein